MSIDSSIILGLASPAKFSCGCHERVDDMLAQRQKRADGSDAFRNRDVAPRLAHMHDDLFASKLQEIIRCLPCSILCLRASHHLPDLGRNIRHTEPSGFWSKRYHGREHTTDSRLVDIDSGHSMLSNATGLGEFIKRSVVDERCVDTTEHIQKPNSHLSESRYHLAKMAQAFAAFQILDIVRNCLYSQHVLAFVVYLERLLAEMQLEHRQIIRRFLDLRLDRRPLSLLLVRSMLAPEKCGKLLYIQTGSRTVYHRLIHLIHIAASYESKVAAVFKLVNRIRIAKPRPLLFVEWQPKAKACGVYPPIAHIIKSPYRVVGRQGVCYFIQSINVATT